MEKDNDKKSPILGFDEQFETGVMADSTGISIEYVDSLMKDYLNNHTND